MLNVVYVNVINKPFMLSVNVPNVVYVECRFSECRGAILIVNDDGK
jgi:hypothetical protein